MSLDQKDSKQLERIAKAADEISASLKKIARSLDGQGFGGTIGHTLKEIAAQIKKVGR